MCLRAFNFKCSQMLYKFMLLLLLIMPNNYFSNRFVLFIPGTHCTVLQTVMDMTLYKLTIIIINVLIVNVSCSFSKCCNWNLLSRYRTKNFEKSGNYANAWSKNDDGQVNTNGPRVTVGEQMGPMGNMITRYTSLAKKRQTTSAI